MADESEILARGREVQKKLWGERIGTGGGGPPGAKLAPEFFDWVAKSCFGMIWSRPALDTKSRSLVTVAQLAALGKTEELRGHLMGALNQGIPREALIEVLMHTACYAGIPAAVNALNAAAPVLGEAGAGGADSAPLR
jgi:4-carboxymuconolactone decarboxylase